MTSLNHCTYPMLCVYKSPEGCCGGPMTNAGNSDAACFGYYSDYGGTQFKYFIANYLRRVRK